MNEANGSGRPRDAAARRAAQRKKRRKRRQIRRMTVIGAAVLLGLIAVFALLPRDGEPNDPPRTENTAASTAPETTASPTETEPMPTVPEITWMTFPADRQLKAQQYFVYSCETGEFLTIGGAADQRIYPASVTKLFTAYVAMQYLEPDDTITAGDALDLVIAGSSVAGIQKGNTLTVEMLIEAMLLPSGNDAAYVLAVEAGRKMGGDAGESAQTAVDRFVARMNAQAKELGMTGTNFANPDGIHRDNHYTTYADLAIMGTLALENPTILKYASVSREDVTFASGETVSWKNTNEIINSESPYYCPYAIGLKTGQTPMAGSCLLSAFTYNDTSLIIGIFGCPEQADRFEDTLQLFNEALDAAR